MGYLVPQSFATRENQDISKNFGHNQWPTVPEVQDLNIAPKPSVERVAGTVLSMRGRIGTHMLL
jgi:hypothetical protein